MPWIVFMVHAIMTLLSLGAARSARTLLELSYYSRRDSNLVTVYSKCFTTAISMAHNIYTHNFRTSMGSGVVYLVRVVGYLTFG